VYRRIQALNRKIHVAFLSGENAEGKAMEELIKLPQIVAAFEPEAREKAHELFLSITRRSSA